MDGTSPLSPLPSTAARYISGGQAGKSSKLGLKGAILRNGEGGNVKENLEPEKQKDGEEHVALVMPP